jgi:hypothetical protein
VPISRKALVSGEGRREALLFVCDVVWEIKNRVASFEELISKGRTGTPDRPKSGAFPPAFKVNPSLHRHHSALHLHNFL